MNLNCDVTFAGYAPYLDYRPMNDSEKATIKTQLSRSFNMEKIESQAINYAVNNLVPVHFKDIKTKRELLVDKISEAVKNRLRIEITYWNNRFEQLNKWSYG
jgi:RNase H-fold protein (predicted Holliday junction resolvase)